MTPGGGEPARVFLVDDHPIVRHGIAELVSQERDLVVCGEAEDEAGALRKILEARPDLVILDLSLKTGDGIEVIKALHARCPQLPILVLTMHEHVGDAERAMRAGARGYLTKSNASEQVVLAARKLLAGEVYVCESIAPRLMQRLVAGPDEDADPVGRLSNRELQVFRLIGRGHSTQEIADDIGLSVKTIETYRANIKRKLDLADSRRLIEHAIRWVVQRGES